MKDLSRHYEQLTADERFRLWVEAMGRKDGQELDRLEATCPRRRYDAEDYDYTRRKRRFTVHALTSALQRLQIDLLASTALVVALANDDNGNDWASDKAIEAFKLFMRLRQGKRDGWLQFCDRIGVDPDAMAAPFLEHVDRAMCIAEAVSEALDEEGADGSGTTDAIAAREFEALIDAWGHAD